MKYKTTIVSRPPEDGGSSFKGEIEKALVTLNKAGFEAMSVMPLSTSQGQTTEILIVAKEKGSESE